MKKFLAVAALSALVAAAVYYSLHPEKSASVILEPATQGSSGSPGNSSSPAAPVPVSSANPNARQADSSPSQVLAAQAGQFVADSSAPANLPPETIMKNVGRAVHQYGEMFGGNPVGTNPEITSQLSGDNPKRINFVNPQPGARINANGELVDAWGTPYFFHQISASQMEIHSAGPDKVMWTSDDLVVK
jgi:hypothetical protein